MELDKPPRKSFREMVEAHARLPLTFEPGTEFEYHVGYPVIGVIIEQITGKTLEEFYQERIFKPLEMKDTSFYLDKKKLDRFSSCYQPKYEKEGWSLTVYDRAETSEKIKGPKIHVTVPAVTWADCFQRWLTTLASLRCCSITVNLMACVY